MHPYSLVWMGSLKSAKTFVKKTLHDSKDTFFRHFKNQNDPDFRKSHHLQTSSKSHLPAVFIKFEHLQTALVYHTNLKCVKLKHCQTYPYWTAMAHIYYNSQNMTQNWFKRGIWSMCGKSWICHWKLLLQKLSVQIKCTKMGREWFK